MEPQEPAPHIEPTIEVYLHELFERQVDLHPTAPALVVPVPQGGAETLSYLELDGLANRMARYLRSRGAGPGKFIGLYFERSAQPLVAILACLKSGAAYVPIDPSYPMERIRHILGESEAILLLTDRAHAPQAEGLRTGDGTGTSVAADVPVFAAPFVVLEEVASEIATESAERLPRAEGASLDDICYVIYTSGTTGRPKGVMATHEGAVAYVRAFNKICGTGPNDRVYQGFSLSFDGSVEEIWMAWSNGSALVAPTLTTPKFGNELGRVLSEYSVTYFSTVPTLLTTITDSIPSLRTLVVSGEVCPAEVVNRWALGELRLWNVYGPTEATVNTTALECRPGAPITIGKPLEGYALHVLDPETLAPVADGEKGELFVAGPTLARGYLKQPELTREKFFDVPDIGRAYRTGDLVRRNSEGDFEFFGRIDGQIKIRGYRVELAEIESLLLEYPGIRTAAVRLHEQDGLQRLAAYVAVSDPSTALDRNLLLAQLEARMPAYMIPATLDELTDFPRLTSGKVDRKRLPEPRLALVREAEEIVEPANALEAKIAAVWASIFGVPRVSVEDDFFLDLGGHSLLAAKAATQLRTALGSNVTVRDIYAQPSVRQLASKLAVAEVTAGIASGPVRKSESRARDVFESLGWRTHLGVGLAQVISMYFLHALAMIPFVISFIAALEWLWGPRTLLSLIGVWITVALLTWPALLAVGIAAKWVIIGRYRPGKYPLWGWMYFRWWLVDRFLAFTGAGALAGTPVLPFYLRLLGAKVGHRCTLGSAMGTAWDLITIGDETSIGADTQLVAARIEDGYLHVGKIEIGNRCFLGIHSALGRDTRMGDDSRLEDQSLLPDGHLIPEGESRRGSPAQPGLVRVPEAGVYHTTRRRRALFGLAHLAAAEAMALLFLVPGVAFLLLYYYAFERGGIPWGTVSLVVSVPVGVVVYCLFFAVVKKLILPRAEPGVYSVESGFYLRKWLSDGLMGASRAMLLPVYTTLYLPPWLRLMGAKIGKRAELSTVWAFSPELIEVGAESFFADGSIVGGKRLFRGRFEIGINRIGSRSFVGNSAILPVGKSLGDRSLLGVQSIPPPEFTRTPDGSEWLGSPSFALPHRPKVGNFSDELTFRPTRKLFAQRAVVDALRILIPGYVGLGFGVIGVLALYWIYSRLGLAAVYALGPLLGITLGIAIIATVCVLKWAVMGKFEPVIKPLWSMYVWLNEMVNGAYESLMAPAIAPYLGTPFAATFLRWIGCRIGRRAYLATTLFSEFDLVEIGDYAALNTGVVVQNHLFEDRVMKSSHLKIGAECSLGNMAVILYDSEMQPRATMGPLSLLMKGENLAVETRWFGIPTVPEAGLALEKQPLEFHNLRGLRRRPALDLRETRERVAEVVEVTP